MALKNLYDPGDGGTAFPIAIGVEIDYYGLTKREYFATQVLAGLLATKSPCPNSELAREAVRVADELLKALEE